MTNPTRRALLSSVAAGGVAAALAPAWGQVATDARDRPPEALPQYQPRFGRTRPVIAVVAGNSGTELTDFVIPFGVLSRPGVAEVVSVSTEPGEVRMLPALRLRMQATIQEFDQRFPQGADYVIVPAIFDETDPPLLDWLRAQAAKGGTIASICIGAQVVASAGLLDGRRATSWWATEARRLSRFPNVRWERNVRYVADGRTISSAGISASLPTSIALVEAIAGRARAASLARELGVADWSSRHDSDAFQPRPDLPPLPARGAADGREIVGVPVTPGIDEVALALTAEAYSHNGRSRAVAYSETDAPVRTRNGLLVVPEAMPDGGQKVGRVLPAIPEGPSAQALDKALVAVEADYGRPAAYASARIMEYPGFDP